MAARPESKAAAARMSLPESKAARWAVAAEDLLQHPSNAVSPYLDVSHVIKLGLSVWAPSNIPVTVPKPNPSNIPTLQSFNPHFQQSNMAGILVKPNAGTPVCFLFRVLNLFQIGFGSRPQLPKWTRSVSAYLRASGASNFASVLIAPAQTQLSRLDRSGLNSKVASQRTRLPQRLLVPRAQCSFNS